jgi:hypothetical protein
VTAPKLSAKCCDTPAATSRKTTAASSSGSGGEREQRHPGKNSDAQEMNTPRGRIRSP